MILHVQYETSTMTMLIPVPLIAFSKMRLSGGSIVHQKNDGLMFIVILSGGQGGDYSGPSRRKPDMTTKG